MKDLEKENCGNLEALKKLGESKKNDYTTEQLLDENLKNDGGESNLEVRHRMLEFLEGILQKHREKSIAVVSHGAAIKYLSQHFCKYNYEDNLFIFNNEYSFTAKFDSPSIIELIFEDSELMSIRKINFN